MSQVEAMNEALLIHVRHAVGWVAPESLIDDGVVRLERDVDAAEVRLMSGYAPGDHPDDLRAGFRASLHPLVAPNLERVNWNCFAGREVCQDALEGKLEAWQAVRRLHVLWRNTNHDPRFKRRIRFDDGCDRVLRGYGPLELYRPLGPFDGFTPGSADQVVHAKADNCLEQHPDTARLTKES